MKKHVLLGTTALVAASLVSGTANAQIEMRLSGFMNQWFGYGNNDEEYGIQDVDQWSNSEVIFRGSGVTDNGLEFGVQVQLEANTVGDQIDESFAFLAGPWGTFQIGSENSAGYLMQIAAPNVGLPINSGSQTQHIVNPTSGALFRSPFGSTFIEPGRDNDGQKLTYFTPRFQGFQLGVSYLPDIDATGGDRNGLVVTDPSEPLSGGVAGTAYENGVSVGVNYVNEFQGVGVSVAGGYYYAESTFEALTPGADRVTLSDGQVIEIDEDFQGFSFGAAFTYGGFEIGGSYAEVFDGIIAGAGDGLGTTEGHGWDVGVAYGQGPWGVSVTYFEGEQDSLFINGGEDEHRSVVGSVRYELGSSIALIGSVGYSEFEGEGPAINAPGTVFDGLDPDDNDGVFVTGGVAITF